MDAQERDAVREALRVLLCDGTSSRVHLWRIAGSADVPYSHEWCAACARDAVDMIEDARAILAAHPAPPATAGEHAKVREIAARHAEDQARPSWATHHECAYCREAIRARGILLAALQRAAGGGA